MSKFIISTKKSIYGPIEVELDGQTYQVNASSESMEKIQETVKDEDKLRGNPISALIKQLVIYTGIKEEAAKKIDLRDLKATIEFISEELNTSEKEKETEEKNESKPAEAE